MSKLRYKHESHDSDSTRKVVTIFLISVLLRFVFDKAAYADMINTTIDQKGISLSEKELLNLNRGGRMWEEGLQNLNYVLMSFRIRHYLVFFLNSQSYHVNVLGAITSKNKFGILSDLSNLWKALSGGAHIEKNEFGET
jgi:hypothetical protein